MPKLSDWHQEEGLSDEEGDQEIGKISGA